MGRNVSILAFVHDFRKQRYNTFPLCNILLLSLMSSTHTPLILQNPSKVERSQVWFCLQFCTCLLLEVCQLQKVCWSKTNLWWQNCACMHGGGATDWERGWRSLQGLGNVYIYTHMIDNAVSVSGIQQSFSITHIPVPILSQILFPFRLVLKTEQSSLCYTVGSY